jgi:hypothetical protein
VEPLEVPDDLAGLAGVLGRLEVEDLDQLSDVTLTHDTLAL